MLISHFASASGGLRPSDPLLGLCPWTALGDFRPPDLLARSPTTWTPSIVKSWVRLCFWGQHVQRDYILIGNNGDRTATDTETTQPTQRCNGSLCKSMQTGNGYRDILNVVANGRSNTAARVCWTVLLLRYWNDECKFTCTAGSQISSTMRLA